MDIQERLKKMGQGARIGKLGLFPVGTNLRELSLWAMGADIYMRRVRPP